MARSTHLRKRIADATTKRIRSPRPVAKRLTSAGAGAMKHHTRHNQGVLLSIESTIINCYWEDSRIDDATVLFVLKSLILEDPPLLLPHAWLYSELVTARSAFLDSSRDIDDVTWNECLRLVLTSVERHSCLHTGETSYLDFVADFMAA